MDSFSGTPRGGSFVHRVVVFFVVFFEPLICLLISNFSMLLIEPEEFTAILNDFDQPGSLAPTGLYLGGTKYMAIQGKPSAVNRGKKGSSGVTIKKTNLAWIFGIYDQIMTGGQCIMFVEKLGDYLNDPRLQLG